LLYLSVKATIKHFRGKKELNEKVLTLTDESTGVSIIAPAFNEEQTIIESVKSFFSQIYSKYEVVIINDGSTDNT
jgi:cellulose synthase/poly-beta-1,6-N-acetylglucosamine synthase-like glycosyltransferase